MGLWQRWKKSSILWAWEIKENKGNTSMTKTVTKTEDGSLFDNTLVDNRPHPIFLNREGVPSY